jgi:hypothetical protein
VEANLGFLRLEAQQYASAAALLRQAIREIEIASGTDDPQLIRPSITLARCENMSGHANEAEALARRAVELATKIFPEGHPVTAIAILEQATALRSLRYKKPSHDLENAPRHGCETILRKTWPATPLARAIWRAQQPGSCQPGGMAAGNEHGVSRRFSEVSECDAQGAHQYDNGYGGKQQQPHVPRQV